MKEVKIKVKELFTLKYLIGGAIYTIIKDSGEKEEVLIKGLLQQDSLKEGIKLKLDRILNSLILETDTIQKRVNSIKTGDKTEEEIKSITKEIDNEDIIIQYNPISFELIEHLSFKDDKGKACNYSLVYNKFFE